jgi:hypothetical protein
VCERAGAMSANYHRMEWKTKRDIMQSIIHCGGIIFGGAVRDWYIHDYNAEKYYQAIKDMEDVGEDKYMDTTFFPEFKHRTILPNDIDATMHVDDLKKLKEALIKCNYELVTKFDRKASEYLPNIYEECGSMRHRRIEITVVPKYIASCRLIRAIPRAMLDEMKDLGIQIEDMIRERFPTNIVITLDLMLVTEPKALAKKHHPPFGPLDFECNGLIANADGMFLSGAILVRRGSPVDYDRKYRAVTQDILDMKAVIAGRVEGFDYRVDKMIKKGWSIHGFQTMTYIRDPDYEGYCIICHDETKEQHYKMKCCDARFHLKCAIKTLTFGDNCVAMQDRCIMCKNTISSYCATEDAGILETIQEAHRNIQGVVQPEVEE